MSRRFTAVSILSVAFLWVSSSVGCSSTIAGAYDGGPSPEGAEFHIARATFKDDKTFTAFAKQAGSDGQVLNGTYDFDGFKLKLKQAGKAERVYSATYNMFSRSLSVSAGKGKQQTLKRM